MHLTFLLLFGVGTLVLSRKIAELGIYQFFNNPTASLGIFKCYPWHIKGHCVLIGDSVTTPLPFP